MPLVIRLDTDLETGLRRMSAEERVPQAELVRRMIRERLSAHNKRKTPYEIAEEMGVIGMDTDPRRDVAENHSKYVKEALRAKRVA